MDDFRDVESINAYRELTTSGVMEPGYMMDCLRYKSRDNARTPMQWSDGPNAGFTDGTPWIGVNPNYRQINAAEQMARPDSVFHFYRRLVELRHTHEIIVYGNYELILPEDQQIYAYTRHWEGRKLTVVCNLTGRDANLNLDAAGELLISNYNDTNLNAHMTLRPWEAFAVLEDA